METRLAARRDSQNGIENLLEMSGAIVNPQLWANRLDSSDFRHLPGPTSYARLTSVIFLIPGASC